MEIIIYTEGFWSGFHENTNAVNRRFFIALFEKVYNTSNVSFGPYETANVLLENTQVVNSKKDSKSWLHTYLFSGESYIREDMHRYSCVLYGQRSHKNIVNCPLYIPYIYSSHGEPYITTDLFQQIANKRTTVPSKDCIVFISNPHGTIRNTFLDILEKYMNVTYAGHYKNNIGGPLEVPYNSREFYDYISQFKYVISMENSMEETYITEKITHGLFAGTIPVYWGSPRVHDYFNKDRILCIDSDSNDDALYHMVQYMKNRSDAEWLERVHNHAFTSFGRTYTLDSIAKQIRNVIYPQKYPLVNQIYCITNPIFEPVRYARMRALLTDLGVQSENVTYDCQTYKQTITDELYEAYVMTNSIMRIRPHIPLRKSELSLTLNFRHVFESIIQNYRDGVFLLFESDVIPFTNIHELPALLDHVSGNDAWDAISLGYSTDHDTYVRHYNEGNTPYRHASELNISHLSTILSNDPLSDGKYLLRKYHTRCTDSLLFSYAGVCKFHDYMQHNQDYGAPFDYYLGYFLETHTDFLFYWSLKNYFNQLSNMGVEASSIQQDSS